MRGMGGVYFQGKIAWIHYSVRGKLYRESSQSTIRADAVRLLKRRLSEIGRGRLIGPTIERTRMEDLAALIRADYIANERRSLDRLNRTLTLHILPAFRGLLAIEVTKSHITRYIADRKAEGATNGTVNRELAALGRMFRLGIPDKVDRVPPIKKLEEHNIRKGFLSPAQFHGLLPHLHADLQPPIHTSYITGWRIKSEIFTRQWSHVDFEGGWLRVEPGEEKNREGKNFPLTPELRVILEAQRVKTDLLQKRLGRIIPWVFHREGKRIRDFRGAWKKACRAVGVPWLVPHDFRRTAIRNLERAGVPRSAAMKMVGHKTESVYRRYAIVEEVMLKEAGEKLSAFHQAHGRATARKKPLRDKKFHSSFIISGSSKRRRKNDGV